MNRKETAAVYALVCATNRLQPSEAEAAGWHAVLEDLGYEQAMAATKRLLRQSRSYPPTAGDVFEAAATGGAPSAGEALAAYMSGDWGVHPLIESAARAVYWDRQNAPKQAAAEFRQHYAAALAKATAAPQQSQAAVGQSFAGVLKRAEDE